MALEILPATAAMELLTHLEAHQLALQLAVVVAST
jgi:hypothetical protein